MQKIELKKYDNYKDSGVEWLGDIPEHWECIRMKHLYKDVSVKKKPNAALLSVTQDKGVIPRSWIENRMVMPSGNLESFKFIEKKDFAISLRSFEGGLEYCHHDGIISPAYTVLKRKKPDLEPDFYKYLFKSFSFISELQTSVVGIREGKNISYPELSYSFLPIPSYTEQTAIANFLDEKCSKIDQAIGQKQKLIELLKERKQILIQNAVTKGIGSLSGAKVKMKDSGVEWIGEIPENWEVEPIKYSLNGIIDCEHKTAPFVDEKHFFVIRTSNVKDGKLVFSDAKYTHEKGFLEWTKRGVPTPGDILLTREAPAGEACIVPKNIKLCLGQRMVWLKVNKERLNPQLAIYFIYSKLGRTYIDYLSSGSTVLHFNMSDIKNIPIISMPILEQDEIVTYIETQSTKIDKSISLQQQQIVKLKEYKSSLINSAVTGKIKIC